MTASNPALLPDPPLFDVTDIAKKGVEGSIERFGLDELELAPNARREISADGLERLAGLLMRSGPAGPAASATAATPPGPSPSTRASGATWPPKKATSSPAPKATRACARCTV